jgi:hypothetical protein
MSGIATLILAHDNPRHVRRLIAALAGLDVFMHVDGKTDDDVVREMTSGAPDVILTPRRRVARRRWSAVEAELDGLRTVLDRSAADHIVVALGQLLSAPLVSTVELEDELAQWRGLSRLELNPIPYDSWSQFIAIRGGGRHGFDRRFLTRGGEPVLVRGVPIPVARRKLPTELRLQASSQWKIYARAHARALLGVLDERPDLRATGARPSCRTSRAQRRSCRRPGSSARSQSSCATIGGGTSTGVAASPAGTRGGSPSRTSRACARRARSQRGAPTIGASAATRRASSSLASWAPNPRSSPSGSTPSCAT